MKFLIVLVSLAVLATCQETGTNEHDDLDIDTLVADPKVQKAWLNCFVDKGPCDKVQASFKADTRDAIENACAKCSAKRKNIVKKFLATLEKTPEDYELYRQKYDPENKYLAKLTQAVA